jgi:hypothetical protein
MHTRLGFKRGKPRLVNYRHGAKAENGERGSADYGLGPYKTLKLFITLDVSLGLCTLVLLHQKINHDGIYRPESFSTDVKGMKIKIIKALIS